MSSLVSTLSNIVSKTNSVVNETHLSFPAFSLTNGLDIDEGLSLLGLVNSIKDSAGNVALGITMGVCAFSMLTPPTNALNAFSQVFAGVAKEFADTFDIILDALEGQIELALQNTIGSVFAVFEAILTLIDAIMKILDTLASIFSSFRNLGNMKLEKWWNDEECTALMASLAACYLNKILGPILDEFKSMTLSTIYEWGGELQNKIKAEMGDGDEIRYYLNQESKLLAKANTLLRGVHNLFS